MSIPGVTLAIKALNEADNIERALISALKAIDRTGGEVLLSDSGSTDQTVEVAARYPVRIVQLANAADKCCGAGAQLAFQGARCDYLYLMDADMVVDAGFLEAALTFLDAHPDVAGVGGMLREQNVENSQFKILAKSLKTNPDWLPGEVARLDGGGLYRLSAIRDAGYFGDRNLHAFEEFDLAARLRARGWKLWRLNNPAVDHYSHTSGSYALLWRRIKSGYSRATGEVLRSALGQSHLGIVLRDLGHIRNGAAVLVWASCIIAVAAASLGDARYLFALVILALLPLAFLSMRRGSLGLGLYSLTTWLISAHGLVDGLLRRRVDPHLSLRFNILQEGRVVPAPSAAEEGDRPAVIRRVSEV